MTVNLVTLAGTWSPPDAGFQADLARMLTSEWDLVHAELFGLPAPRFRWVPVPYSASFGPINPPYPGALAYEQSVQEGLRNTIDAIRALPGRFVLSGYSQGAEVVGRACIELVGGVLKDRLQDCVGCVTFGDPARQKTDVSFGGGDGWGISRLVIPQGVRRVTYAVKGDMYCTCPDSQAGDQMHAMYAALTRIGDGKINGHTELLAEVARLFKNPIAGGISAVDAVIRAAQVGQHNNYGKWVPHAAAIVEEWCRNL